MTMTEPQTDQITTALSAREIVAALDIDIENRRVGYQGAEVTIGEGPTAAVELSTWLYLQLHVGNLDAFSLDALRPDPDFESAIMAAVPSFRIPTPAKLLGREETMTAYDVQRVRVGSQRGDADASDDAIELRCSRPNLSPGFFMFIHELEPLVTERLQRFYIGHSDPDAALRDWADCLHRLCAQGLSFRTKMLSRRSSYPRHDSIVVYASENVDQVVDVLGAPTLLSDHRSFEKSDLTRWACPKVATGAEPVDMRFPPGSRSFGQHRTLTIARSIVAAFEGEPVESVLELECSEANIDPADLSRNLR